jgi:hypothetical protein
MPAPQATVVQQLARTKFASFGLKVPTNWQDPQGDAADHYGRAFQDNEKTSAPGTPPLFQPASANKYHTDTQKMHISAVGDFIDGICSAICSAWSKWHQLAAMTGVIIAGPVANGGQIVGPPWTPLILASAPKSTPMQLKYSTVVANVIGTQWLAFTSAVKVFNLPWYPLFAMMTSPIAPPTPNLPVPFAALIMPPPMPSPEPLISAETLKGMMILQHADPMAPFHKELYESIADAFDKTYKIWKTTTTVTNVLGTGPVPTFAPPVVPGGPVVGGVGNMPPGGFK